MTDVQASSEETSVSITVDGVQIAARPGELIIDAAEREGIFIPRFCYHPRMDPVGMCRMCLVEVSGPRGFSLQPACYLKVAEGQEVVTQSDKARKAQEGVIEFLLVNHPLDCPVCDKGGECPLQDQSLSHGPGETRFVEEKRHWAKPIEIGHFVALDRERCIQCARCTRFADEIAGDAEINFAERGDRIEVAPFPTKPFNSYFSGNTVQICPVGALTAAPYRFKARPWDLEQVESTCTVCSVGCRHVAQSSAGQLVRFLGVDSDPVNQSWLCDKGRFSHETLYSDSRVSTPLLRKDDQLQSVRWHEALAAAASALDAARAQDPSSIAVIGGARLSNEDAYAWAKLAKGVIGTDSVDAQLGDGLPAKTVLGLPKATIDQACAARVVILLAPDLREELPILYLRLRDAARRGNLSILEVSPLRSALSGLAAQRLSYLPGEAAALVSALSGSGSHEVGGASAEEIASARQLLGDGSDVVVVLGRPTVADSGESIASAASILHNSLPGIRFLSALRRSNVHGALDMGLTPGFAPGRVLAESASTALQEAWGGPLPTGGRDTQAILEAASSGEIEVLVLLGSDPLADFPDRDLAERGIAGARTVISLATHHDESSEQATIVLPVSGDGERAGTTTNLEGRVTRLAPKVTPPGVAWAPWVIAIELSARLGGALGAESLEALTDEIASVAPAYTGVDVGLLGSPDRRDGIVIPLAAGTSSTPRLIDPIATPGITSVDEQGAPLRVGAALPPGGVVTESAEIDHVALFLLSGATEPVVAPRLDSYSHRLFLQRLLYDAGTLVRTSPSMQALSEAPVVRVHPSELAHLGLESGDQLRVRSARGDVELPAEADPNLDRHLVVIRLGAGGAGNPMALVDASAIATDVRLETI